MKREYFLAMKEQPIQIYFGFDVKMCVKMWFLNTFTTRPSFVLFVLIVIECSLNNE